MQGLLPKQKIGLVSNSGHGGPTVIDVPVETLDYIVNALKSNAYTLTLESAGQLNEEPTDSRNWFGDAVTQMIDEVDRLRKLKRLAKTHVIVRQSLQLTNLSSTRSLRVIHREPGLSGSLGTISSVS